MIHILAGEADLTVGDDAHDAIPGTWLRMAAGTMLLGEAFALVAAAFFDRDRRDASISEIVTDWGLGNQQRALGLLAERLMNDIIMAGTLGIWGQPVDWAKSLTDLPNVLRSADNRTLPAVYGEQPAKFTTDQANALGIKEMVAEFTTRGFAADSGVNIRQMASEVNGATVTIKSRVAFDKTRIGPSSYAEWRAFCEAADRAFAQRLVVGASK